MKRKLLLMAVALLCTVGTWAQASFNHIYTEGVTASAGSNYFLYNIGSGMFLTDGMDFGTHASVDHGGRILTLANNTNGFSIYTQPYSANGSDEKKGYLTTNGFIDTGTNDADWVFTPVSVAGYTNAYTIKNSESQYLYWECKDGLHQGEAGQFINVGASTDDNYSYWLLIPLTTRQAENDYTYLLRNTEFQHPWEWVMWSNTQEWTNYCGGNKENTCAEMISKAFDVSQTISVSVANGKYIIYNQGFYRNDDTTKPAYLYANTDTKVMRILNSESEGTTENMSGASTSFSAGKYVNSVSTIVTNNSLKVGVKTEGTNWTIFDNFYLEYLGNDVQFYAPTPTDFSSVRSATNGTWYNVTTTNKGYYSITASGAVTLSYTQDETKDADDNDFSTITFTGEGTQRVLLNAGTLYFKTNSDKNISITYLGNDIQYYATELPGNGAMIAGQWYSVTIATAGYYNATATSDLNEIVYTTAGNTDKDNEGSITANFTSTGNTLSATTYYVMSTSNQTFTIKPIISTIATAYPDNGGLSAETWYVYTIPMTGDYYFSATDGVVYTTNGDQVYDAATTSAAVAKVSFTKDATVYVKSTSVQTVKLEGKFYLATTVNGVTKWLNKDGSGYTYVYDTGLQFVLKSDNDGNYQLLFSEGNYLNDVGSNWQTKAEGSKNDDWKLSSVEGGYKILLGINTACELFVKDTTTGLVEITHSEATGNIWQFVTPDDYDDYPSLVAINEKITEVGTLPYADPSKKPSTYNGTTDVASHITSLTTALRAYFESNALAEGVVGATNYTSYITNPTCPATSHPSKDKYSYNPPGWSSSLIVENKDVSGYINSAGVEREFYYSSHGSFWANDMYSTTATMSQTVSSLPRGKYLLTVCGRITTGATMTLLANGQEAACPTGTTGGVFGNGWNDTSLEFTVGKEGTADIGVEMYNNNTREKWFSFDNFRLVRIGNLDAVTLDEDENEIATIVAKNADVTLNRTFNANWATFVVPFDIDNTTLKDQFGDDVCVSEFSADDKTGVTFTPMAEPAITANKPVLMKTNTEQSSFTFDGVEIKEATPTFSQAGVNFVGNYAGEITIPNELDTYFVKSNALKKSTGTQKLKGFRAYFTVNADSPVKAFFENGFNFDDADAIRSIDNGQLTMDNAEIYNLAGQKMSKLQKGVNIVNGKKVLVK